MCDSVWCRVVWLQLLLEERPADGVFELWDPNLLMVKLVGCTTSPEPAFGQPIRAEFSAVPEPSTYLAGALLLFPFGAASMRRFFKS